MPIIVTGIRHIDQALAAFTPTVERKVVSRAVRDVAKIVAKDIQRNAPRGASGKLKASVKVRALKRRKHSFGMAAMIGETATRGATYYASFLEFGAPGHLLWGGPVYPLKPRPFVRPSYERHKRLLKYLTTRALADLIYKINVAGTLKFKP